LVLKPKTTKSPLSRVRAKKLSKIPGVYLTGWMRTAIITVDRKMTGNYLDGYGPLLLMFIGAMGLSGAILTASALIGRHKRTREKDMAYECGVTPTGDARDPFSVHYYLVALLFILFDIEAIFLYPWALVYRGLGWFGFVEMLLYIIILLSGYIYLWKKGALEWTR